MKYSPQVNSSKRTGGASSVAVLIKPLVMGRAAITARWPKRDRSSDGWIGNAAHQQHESDHNPDSRGLVHAIDVDKDGIHVPTVLAAMMLHPCTRYVIHNRRTFHVNNQFSPVPYTGDNPHTGHIHESAEHTTAAESSTASWVPITGAFVWLQMSDGAKGAQVRQLQAYLNGHGYTLKLDADFGGKTQAAVRSFQAKWKLKVDGVVGPNTRKALFTK